MKILQINSVYRTSSTGRTTYELDEFLNARGHESYVAYGENKVAGKDVFHIGTNWDHKLHALLSRVSGLVGYFSTVHTKRFIKTIESISPDIIHLRNLHSNYIDIPLLLSYLSKNEISTVITLHDCFFYTGRCTHYTLDNCYKWQNSCGTCPRLMKDNKSWFFDRSKKMLREKKQLFESIKKLAVIGVSDWITEEAKKSILQNALIIKRIYNWIDLEVFKPEQNSFSPDFIILGVASYWSNDKGLDKFIELASHLSDKMKIIIVGKLHKNVDLPGNVVSVKETSSMKELALHYNSADVFINFSREESFGKVSAEALACGTPIITNKYTANPELVGEKCGYIVENTKEAFEAVNLIKKNKKTFYSANCRRFAENNFDKEKNTLKYLKLYEKLTEVYKA